MLQTQPPPPSWFLRLVTAAVVLGIGSFFAISAATMGADGYDENTSAHRISGIDPARGIATNLDLEAGTYDLSFVTIYGGEPATTGWNINVQIITHAGVDALNKTYAWSQTTSCFSCSSTSGSARQVLERVTLQAGNYSVVVKVNFTSTTGAYAPTRATLSFLDPQKELFYGSYIWIGLGFYLVQLGILGLWHRGNRKRFAKWYEWKRASYGETEIEPKKGRRGKRKGK